MHKQDSNGGSEPLCRSASGFEHWLTGVVALVITVAFALGVYQSVAAMAQQLAYLSSTAVVFLFVGVWLLLWSLMEVAWEYRAGRLFAG